MGGNVHIFAKLIAPIFSMISLLFSPLPSPYCVCVCVFVCFSMSSAT